MWLSLEVEWNMRNVEMWQGMSSFLLMIHTTLDSYLVAMGHELSQWRAVLLLGAFLSVMEGNGAYLDAPQKV